MTPPSSPPPSTWHRSVKRKMVDPTSPPTTPRRPSSAPSSDVTARVDASTECAALRETLEFQQETIQDLCREIDEERNASSSATSEAMSMILRLQREKAETHMEYRQFKRFAEEKMEHDQHQIALLEDALFKLDQEVQALTFEVESYKHRLASYVGNEREEEEERDSDNDSRVVYDYPSLKCKMPDEENYENENYSVLEKEVVMGEDLPEHRREFSVGSSSSFFNREVSEGKREEEFEDAGGDDDVSDRVYTVDAVHGVATQAPSASVGDGNVGSTRDSVAVVGGGSQSEDIKNLYTRIQALEVDRESLKQAVVSMQAENMQLALLKEIALNLSKGIVQQQPQEIRVVKRTPSFGFFSIFSIYKWVASFIFGGKKQSQPNRHQFGIPGKNIGLLFLLSNSPRMHQLGCLTRRRD